MQLGRTGIMLWVLRLKSLGHYRSGDSDNGVK